MPMFVHETKYGSKPYQQPGALSVGKLLPRINRQNQSITSPAICVNRAEWLVFDSKLVSNKLGNITSLCTSKQN